MVGAAHFKVGYKTGGVQKQKNVPHFFQMWGTSKQISVAPIEYIEICCLVVALINVEAKTIFIGPPCTPCTPLVPKVRGHCPTPHTPVAPPMIMSAAFISTITLVNSHQNPT